MSNSGLLVASGSPPVDLLAPAVENSLLAGGGGVYGRVSPFRSLRGVTKVAVIIKVSGANSSPVTITLLQAQDLNGTNAKAAGSALAYQNSSTGASDTLAALGAQNFVILAASATNQILLFEAMVEALVDTANGFTNLAVQTSCAAAGNASDAVLLPFGAYARPFNTTYA